MGTESFISPDVAQPVHRDQLGRFFAPRIHQQHVMRFSTGSTFLFTDSDHCESSLMVSWRYRLDEKPRN